MMRLAKIIHCERGGSAIEYALVASLISIAAIAAMNNLGSNLVTKYTSVSTDLQ